MKTYQCILCGETFQQYPSNMERKDGVRKPYCSRECGFAGRRKRIKFFCMNCGEEDFYRQSQAKYYKNAGSFCSRNCHYEYRRKYPESTPNWRGEDAIGKDGYIRANGTGNKGRRHRIIMEEHLGRKLKRSEYIHHINGDKTDNQLENLQIMTASEHSKHHYLKGEGLAKINS